MRHCAFYAPIVVVFGAVAALAQPVGEKPKTDSPSPKEGVTKTSTADQVVLEFEGRIDGSDRIEITSTHAFWSHRHWRMPGSPMKINGVAWQPRESRVLANAGATRFLPEAVDFSSARLEKMRGRDTVVVEPRSESVVVHLCDTPNGGDLYQFRVVFEKPCRRAELRLVGRIDGSDQLHLDASGARWVHRHWGWPPGISLNGVEWVPRKSRTLANAGPTQFLDGPVDWSSARLVVTKARDTVVLERKEKGLVVHFADNPLGGAEYDVTILFGE